MRLLNPNSRLLVRDREILFVAEKFLPRCDDHRLDELLGEWKRYQASTDLPNCMDQDAIDIWWQQVLHSKDAAGEDIYTELPRLIKTLLVLPYNQAPVERVFSVVNKIDAKFQPLLDNDSVYALLACKMNSNSECYNTKTPNELIRAAKTATLQYNTAIIITLRSILMKLLFFATLNVLLSITCQDTHPILYLQKMCAEYKILITVIWLIFA